ncbi:MAG: hypothetical protein CVU21_25455 [Betaproteobacteria bacterium HGW-Betaproteobacteria-15]|nr:MAG: hypothetical protein CVU21_25455 [Betaproteobacteria bacterium HGW-Betaproteobacteria-15]
MRISPTTRAAQGTPKGTGLRLAFSLGTFFWRSKRKCLGRRAETRPSQAVGDKNYVGPRARSPVFTMLSASTPK